MRMAADDSDGDRIIDMVSPGTLYRGGEWERKYWSCTRGKDRYPYPVGYHAIRHFSGISYIMQIQQGPRGPIFQVTSTQGDTVTGQTPDIAWKNFHKKTAAKVRNWQKARSFPHKIDGAELFGFKNASVQRLLRQLLVEASGSVEANLPCPSISGAASQLTHKVESDVSNDYEEQHACVDKTVGTAKRNMDPILEEGTAKRAHYQVSLTSADNSNAELDKSAHQSSNKECPTSIAQPGDVSGSRHIPPLLEQIPCDSKCLLVNDNLGEYVPSSSQEDGLSSSSYLGSEKSDLDSAETEVAKSMMAFFLPQAIPLLKKARRKKKVKQKKKEEPTVSMQAASTQNPSINVWQGVTLSTTIVEGNMNSAQTNDNGKPLYKMVEDNSGNGDCMNDEQVSKLDDVEAFVADSFEDDAQIWGDKTSKPMGSHHHEYDDACSREPIENSKLLQTKRENHPESKSQVGNDSTDTPDVIYDHEKGQYILSDSLLACLEEEFGLDDSSHHANYDHGNINGEQMQVEQQFKDSAKSVNDVLSISMNGSDCKNSGNGQNVFHHHTIQALSNFNHLNDIQSRHPETSIIGSDHHLEFMGCYLHPMPVLSIILNTKHNSSSLHIYVLCGVLESCQRFLYAYNITPEDEQETPPCFVGYTSLLLPSLEQSSTANFTFGRSGLQFTPDGQFLILLSSIRIPCCRLQNIDCSCSLCKLDQCDDNSLKIVSVNFGYTSLLTKLMPHGTVSCFLICEPNYVVAAEHSRNLHIWMMVTGWSVISKEYIITSSCNVGPSILELRIIPKSSSLIVGHDGAGGFCLWDISKQTLLSTFGAPGNIVFQILPLGLCSLQEDIIDSSADDIQRRLQEITVSDMPRRGGKESILVPSGNDIAIWIMASSASIAEYQHDLRAKEHNARWRLALLANNKVFMGNIFDPRATAVNALGDYGFAGTHEGLLYMWELSSGRKLAATHCFTRGRVSCIAVDAKSSLVAVADDRCQLSLYTQNKETKFAATIALTTI